MACLVCCFPGSIQHACGQFSTVINLPPDPDIGDNLSIGSDTQLNLSEGGKIGSDFDAGDFDGSSSNVEVNISGGTVGWNFRANVGSEVNITGGTIDGNFSALGSLVNFSEGTIGRQFEALNSTVNVSGGTIFEVSVRDDSVLNFSGGTVFNLSAEDSEVNLFAGSVSGRSNGGSFRAASGSVINIFGGSVGDRLFADTGSVVNLLGRSGGSPSRSGGRVRRPSGSIGASFRANTGSEVNIAGGSVGSGFQALPDSMFQLFGGEFRLDGVLVGGLDTVGNSLPLNLVDGSVLSGTLSDGTPFVFSSFAQDKISAGTLTLYSTTLPRIGPAPIVASSDLVPLGIRAGQTLIVDDGALLDAQFQAGRGSTVIVDGGAVDRDFKAVGAQVTLTEGSIRGPFQALNDSKIDISGGWVGDGGVYGGSEINVSGGQLDGIAVNANSVANISGGSVGSIRATDSELNISGGSINTVGATDSVVNLFGDGYITRFNANRGSTVNISGGSTGTPSTSGSVANNGSVVNISGGSIGDYFFAKEGSQVKILGNEFRVDGNLIAGISSVGSSLAINVQDGSVLSGLLADGTPFAFSSLDYDRFAEGTLTLAASEVAPQGPTVISLPSDPAPRGVRTGQTVIIEEGGAVGDNFSAAWGSAVSISGGQVGSNFETVGTEVTITGGTIGRGFDAFHGSVVKISGGHVDSLDANSGSEVNISGEAVVNSLIARAGSVANISGGTVGGSTHAFRAEVNISGGTTGYFFQATDSKITISGGSLGNTFRASEGSQVIISGGSLGNGFFSYEGSQVNITGGEFRLNNVPLAGLSEVGDVLPFNLPWGSVLSGTLADGTPFAFSSDDGDRFEKGAITLTTTMLPPVGPTTIFVSNDYEPLGVRSGQTLIVEEQGTLANNFNAGFDSKVVINGGHVGSNFEAVGAQVEITGGTFDNEFQAHDGSVANISGGTFEGVVRAFKGSDVSISGGQFGWGFTASGGVMQISGGSFGDRVTVFKNSRVVLSGGEFRLDGVPIRGLESLGDSRAISYSKDSVLSGTFADGSPFAFSNTTHNPSGNSGGTFTLATAELPTVGPAVISLPNDAAPFGIRKGQTLVVEEGGVVPDNFNAGWGSFVHITGGHVGRNFEAMGAQVAISGGEIAESFAANSSIVNMNGGTVSGTVTARAGSVVNISGGSVEGGFVARNGSTINISGGEIGKNLSAYEDSKFNISGGSIQDYFYVRSGSELHLFGTQFAINHADITETLTLNVPFEIEDRRNVRLTGLLADGSPFRFFLDARYSSLWGQFDPNATLTITLVAAVPEPSTELLVILLATTATLFHRVRRCLNRSSVR